MKITSRYDEITNLSDIKNDLIKPLHQYAQKISPKPIVQDNYFDQLVYSESLVKMTDYNNIELISRPAIQQYRKSAINIEAPFDCFHTLFEFYVSWFPDINKDVCITNTSNDNSPFYIPNKTIINFQQFYSEPRENLEPIWIPFFLKKDYLQFKKGCAKIELNSIAYRVEM